jgi:cytochrome c biogenesis protein CcmG/thiol:disulfide interchange protein DsbE
MNESASLARPEAMAGRLITVAAAIGILLVLAYGFWTQRSMEEAPAPNFTLSLFDGGEITLAELRGRVVVVNFWASWCIPCRKEAPALEKAWREYRDDGVSFIGVNVKDVRSKALAFIEEFDITYPNGPDDPYGRISRSFRVYGLPETFLMAKDGEIAKRFIGAITEDELGAILDQLVQR